MDTSNAAPFLRAAPPKIVRGRIFVSAPISGMVPGHARSIPADIERSEPYRRIQPSRPRGLPVEMVPSIGGEPATEPIDDPISGTASLRG
jgi:hypothetical protein